MLLLGLRSSRRRNRLGGFSICRSFADCPTHTRSTCPSDVMYRILRIETVLAELARIAAVGFGDPYLEVSRAVRTPHATGSPVLMSGSQSCAGSGVSCVSYALSWTPSTNRGCRSASRKKESIHPGRTLAAGLRQLLASTRARLSPDRFSPKTIHGDSEACDHESKITLPPSRTSTISVSPWVPNIVCSVRIFFVADNEPGRAGSRKRERLRNGSDKLPSLSRPIRNRGAGSRGLWSSKSPLPGCQHQPAAWPLKRFVRSAEHRQSLPIGGPTQSRTDTILEPHNLALISAVGVSNQDGARSPSAPKRM